MAHFCFYLRFDTSDMSFQIFLAQRVWSGCRLLSCQVSHRTRFVHPVVFIQYRDPCETCPRVWQFSPSINVQIIGDAFLQHYIQRCTRSFGHVDVFQWNWEWSFSLSTYSLTLGSTWDDGKTTRNHVHLRHHARMSLEVGLKKIRLILPKNYFILLLGQRCPGLKLMFSEPDFIQRVLPFRRVWEYIFFTIDGPQHFLCIESSCVEFRCVHLSNSSMSATKMSLFQIPLPSRVQRISKEYTWPDFLPNLCSCDRSSSDSKDIRQGGFSFNEIHQSAACDTKVLHSCFAVRCQTWEKTTWNIHLGIWAREIHCWCHRNIETGAQQGCWMGCGSLGGLSWCGGCYCWYLTQWCWKGFVTERCPSWIRLLSFARIQWSQG